MRLGQLTRQLDIETTKVVKFLATKGIEIEDHPNSKLSDEALELANEKFKPTPIEIAVPKIETKIEVIEEEIALSATTQITEEVTIKDEAQIEKPDEIQEIAPTGIRDQDTTEETTTQEAVSVETIEETKVLEFEKPTNTIFREEEPTSSPTLEEGEKIITLAKEEVAKLIEAGEIVSEIEAEAATLDESGIIKAKLHKLEGLQVKGKIELPNDPRRAKKEEQRKAQAEAQKSQDNAGKTIDGVHPTKRAKEEGERIKEELIKAEEAARLRAEKARIRKEKEAEKAAQVPVKSKKKNKYKNKVVEKVLTPEEIKKKNTREKRQRLKEKENAPKEEKSFWQSFVDFFKF